MKKVLFWLLVFAGSIAIAVLTVLTVLTIRRAQRDWKIDQVESLLPKGTHLLCEENGEVWLPRYDGQTMMCLRADAPSRRKR